MKLFLLLAVLVAAVLPLAGCSCAGQPTATLGLPTFSFGNNVTTPTVPAQVPLMPAPQYTQHPAAWAPLPQAPAAAAPQWCAPAAPAPAATGCP